MIETDKIFLAASWIKEKKIIAYPTEGVWGIGCINNKSVISKLSEIKQRPKDKKYILLFKSVDDLRKKFDDYKEKEWCKGELRIFQIILQQSLFL